MWKRYDLRYAIESKQKNEVTSAESRGWGSTEGIGEG